MPALEGGVRQVAHDRRDERVVRERGKVTGCQPVEQHPRFVGHARLGVHGGEPGRPRRVVPVEASGAFEQRPQLRQAPLLAPNREHLNTVGTVILMVDVSPSTVLFGCCFGLGEVTLTKRDGDLEPLVDLEVVGLAESVDALAVPSVIAGKRTRVHRHEQSEHDFADQPELREVIALPYGDLESTLAQRDLVMDVLRRDGRRRGRCGSHRPAGAVGRAMRRATVPRRFLPARFIGSAQRERSRQCAQYFASRHGVEFGGERFSEDGHRRATVDRAAPGGFGHRPGGAHRAALGRRASVPDRRRPRSTAARRANRPTGRTRWPGRRGGPHGPGRGSRPWKHPAALRIASSKATVSIERSAASRA